MDRSNTLTWSQGEVGRGSGGAGGGCQVKHLKLGLNGVREGAGGEGQIKYLHLSQGGAGHACVQGGCAWVKAECDWGRHLCMGGAARPTAGKKVVA